MGTRRPRRCPRGTIDRPLDPLALARHTVLVRVGRLEVQVMHPFWWGFLIGFTVCTALAAQLVLSNRDHYLRLDRHK